MKFFSAFPDGSCRAHNATVVGDVTIGAQSSLWFNVVVRGDVAPVVIGRRVNVQDGSVIHCDTNVTCTIDDDVSIGHGAIIHGQSVGQGTLIGMRATLLAHCRIGARCLVAAGAVVTPKTIVPDGHLIAGLPAKVIRPLRPDELDLIASIAPRYLQLSREWLEGKWGPDRSGHDGGGA